MKNKATKTDARKVYVGFWTSQDTKDEVARIAADNRQSMSACIDGIVEDHVFARRRRRSR